MNNNTETQANLDTAPSAPEATSEAPAVDTGSAPQESLDTDEAGTCEATAAPASDEATLP